MFFGKTDQEKFFKRQQKRTKQFRKIIPHEVFTWLPRRLEDGRYAWFEKVWRVDYFADTIRANEIYYTLDKHYAHNLSIDLHRKLFESNIGENYKEVLNELRLLK